MTSIEIDSAQIDDDTVNMGDEDDVVEIQDNEDKTTIKKTKRPRKTTSTVWNYFELIEGKNKKKNSKMQSLREDVYC